MSDFEGLWIKREILQNKDLSDFDKLLLAEIQVLEPCTASNQYLADIFNVSRRKVMRSLKELQGRGYIKVTYFSPVQRKITSDKIGTSDKKSTSDKIGITSTKIDTSTSDKNGTTSTKIVTQEYKDNKKKIGEKKKSAPTSIFDIDQDVLHFYQDNIQLITKPFEVERLADDIEHFGAAKCIEAIKRAVLRNKRSLGYVESILRSWEVNGYDEGQKAPAPPPPKEKLKYFGEGDDY